MLASSTEADLKQGDLIQLTSWAGGSRPETYGSWKTNKENVMTDSVLTYRDCYDQCKSLALEIIEEHKDECNEIEDFMDKTWEWVDQHEWVIYYYRAHQFLAAIDGDLRAEAEVTLEDMGATPESYDDYASQITYWAITIWVSKFIENSYLALRCQES